MFHDVVRPDSHASEDDRLSAPSALVREWVRAPGHEGENVSCLDVEGGHHGGLLIVEDLEKALRELSMKRRQSLKKRIPIVNELGGIIQHHSRDFEGNAASATQALPCPAFAHADCSVQCFDDNRLAGSRGSDENHTEPIPRIHQPGHLSLYSPTQVPFNHTNQSVDR